MSIKDFIGKIKPHWANIKDQTYSPEKGLKIKDDIYIVLILMLVCTASYGLGKLSSYERVKAPISIIKGKDSMYASALSSITKTDAAPGEVSAPTAASGEVVASKSGTKYYYPTCSGVSKIKEENKVWYKSIAEARAKGLTPAANCAGLQ